MSKFSFIFKNIKLDKKRTLMRQVCLLVAIAVLLIFAVFAWFVANDGSATASGLNVVLEAGDSLDISLNNGEDFVSSIDLMSDDDQKYIGQTNKIKGNLSMTDITSDGKTFFRPKFKDLEDNKREPNTDEENWDNATVNRNYIAQTIVFRTTDPSDIYMGSGTGITTSCEVENKKLVSSNPDEIGNKSDQGNFSKDCIVGALRISAVNNGTLRFLCIPRTDVELVEDSEGNITVNYGDDVSDAVNYHLYYSPRYNIEKEPVLAEDVIYDFSDMSKTYIATTTETEEGSGVYTATATINIWLEGCDNETRRALSGGKFKVNLDFTAVASAVESETPTD